MTMVVSDPAFAVLARLLSAERAQSAIPEVPGWLGLDAETFDLDTYLDDYDPQQLADDPEYRRRATRGDPLLFAVVYLVRHLRSDATGGRVTFADAHLQWCARAREWIGPVVGPREHRHAEIAPRECGKSSWLFLIIPLWAAAHQHVRFIAAFADSTGQAETHLSTFKSELDGNDLLRSDYPELCTPARRTTGSTVADRQGMLHTRSGFTFAARGIDSSTLGLKVGQRRPDVILLDDVEPDESNYSVHQAGKRLRTIIDAILPMNLLARVVLIGTVTMPGSIVHQLVRSARGDVDDDSWIVEERFVAHHMHPIVVRGDGSERSIWPAKWPMGFLNEIRHTRSYLKNFANDPAGVDGAYWSAGDIRYGRPDNVTGEIISLDPATTTARSSDLTGVAVLGFAPTTKTSPSRVVVEDIHDVRLVGEALRAHVLDLIAARPLVRLVLVESNQGGEHWQAILHDLPVKLVLKHQTVKKEVRAAMALRHYQDGRVTHAVTLPRGEEQMMAFPRAAHDDMVDAVATGVLRLLGVPDVQRRTSATVFPR